MGGFIRFFFMGILSLFVLGCKVELSSPQSESPSLPPELVTVTVAVTKEPCAERLSPSEVLERSREYVGEQVGTDSDSVGFDSNVDFNKDGRISALDRGLIAAFPRVRDAASIARMVEEAVRAQIGSPSANLLLDFNGDDAVTAADRAMANDSLNRLRYEDIQTRLVEHVDSLVGSVAGDSDYDANLDFDGDDRISAHDRDQVAAFPDIPKAAEVADKLLMASRLKLGWMVGPEFRAFDIDLSGTITFPDVVQLREALAKLRE